MRSAFSCLKGACQESRIMLSRPDVAQVKRISGNGQEHSQSQIIISPSPYHRSKSDFRHHLIPPVLISLLLRVLGSPLLSLSSSRFVLLHLTDFAYFSRKSYGPGRRISKKALQLVPVRRFSFPGVNVGEPLTHTS